MDVGFFIMVSRSSRHGADISTRSMSDYYGDDERHMWRSGSIELVRRAVPVERLRGTPLEIAARELEAVMIRAEFLGKIQSFLYDESRREEWDDERYMPDPFPSILDLIDNDRPWAMLYIDQWEDVEVTCSSTPRGAIEFLRDELMGKHDTKGFLCYCL